ncbi:MAG: tetratricopeptide repeat protein [Ignavibacteriae bacterium]|nr:tetratricopeptide repeat protein [Ignavibacteriota bacterium]
MNEEELKQLLNRAIEENIKGNFEEAERLANELLAALDSLQDIGEKGVNIRTEAMIAIGVSSMQRGKTHHALELGTTALSQVIPESEAQANVMNFLGGVYKTLSDFPKSLEYFAKALVIAEKLDIKKLIAGISGNIGIVYADISEYENALEWMFKALAIHNQLDQKSHATNVMSSIGHVYKSISEYMKALDWFMESLALQEKLGMKAASANTTGNIGLTFWHLGEYSKAMEWITKSLAVNIELDMKMSAANQTCNVGLIYWSSSDFSKALEWMTKALGLYEELGMKADASIARGNIGKIYLDMGEYSTAKEWLMNALAINEELGMKTSIAIVMGNIGNLYFQKNYEEYDINKSEEYLLLSNALSEELNIKHNLYENHKVLAELYKQSERWKESVYHSDEYHKFEKDVLNDEARKQAERFEYQLQNLEREKNLAIERARAQATNEILANILPMNITERLINGEKKIADSYENVSVMFVDIVGFTPLSAKLSAEELIDLLDIVFTRFDAICKKNGVEKIKTIGDAYLAVCGAPIHCENHAERITNTALEMLEEFEIEQKFSIPVHINFRIGLHCGRVVAGIIGENKYLYDLWGDAVNTASRMESHGEAGKIHASEEFIKTLAGESSSKDSLSRWERAGVRVLERGEMEIKGKGIMKTYYLAKTVHN